MKHLLKRNITNNDIKEICLRANKLFPYGHGWEDYFKIRRNDCEIFYCDKCNLKFLTTHDDYLYNISNELNWWRAYIHHLKEYDKYTCDEWIIKNIIE